jgi:hypothetical protein
LNLSEPKKESTGPTIELIEARYCSLTRDFVAVWITVSGRRVSVERPNE